jgi:anti-anti-sigma factor
VSRDDDLLQIAVERTGTTVRISARGEIDLSTAHRLREQARREIAADGEIILLDLSDVSFIDSTGLHAIVDAVDQAPQRMRVLPSETALRLFTLTGTIDRLPLVGHPDDGRDATRQDSDRQP